MDSFITKDLLIIYTELKELIKDSVQLGFFKEMKQFSFENERRIGFALHGVLLLAVMEQWVHR